MPDSIHAAPPVHTLDLHFQGASGAIAAYLVPHEHGGMLVECGPGSSTPALLNELASHGLEPSQVSDVLLTHIHLDHAGSAGWWAKQGARIHVHPFGAPHLLNPEKLISSARRIYGDAMQTLWGDFLPVPEGQLVIHQDNESFSVADLTVRPLDMPGHASHHFVYICQKVCFTGDVGGIRVGGAPHLRLPLPPPDLDLALWQRSVLRLQQEQQSGAFAWVAPTHFGVFADAAWHITALRQALEAVTAWMEQVMPSNPDVDELNRLFLDWTLRESLADGLPSDAVQRFEIANPSWMAARGIYRYWHKVLHPE
jgi:glyoxylase-like metal-dependent hydrolase (beta-lactamase superfamily II)